MHLSFWSLPAYKKEQRLAKKRIDLRSTSKTLSHQRYLHKIFWWISKKIALRAKNPCGQDSRVSNVMDVSTGTTELVIQVCYHLIRYFWISRAYFSPNHEKTDFTNWRGSRIAWIYQSILSIHSRVTSTPIIHESCLTLDKWLRLLPVL